MEQYEGKMDLRVRKTRRSLTEALIGLLGEKSYGGISVSEICSRAEVRRATFYKHFRDKDDLLVYIVKEQVRRFSFQNRVAFDPRHLGAYYTGLFESLLGFLEENAEVSRAVFGGAANQPVLDIISAEMEADMVDELRCVDPAVLLEYGDPEMIAAMHIGAVMECARWWVMKGQRLTREQVVEQFGNVMLRF